jgi:glycosyltransferase involved in cell wall biosynthesis
MSRPKVTVLMSVYNGEIYLREAIESILSQTFRDFEFIILNDGSEDDSAQIIERYCDTRIKVVENRQNLGLTRSLNRGLSMAQGEYIARMDADDISFPNRLGAQVGFLDSNPEVGVLGTGFQLIDQLGKTGETLLFPGEHGLLRWMMCFFFNPVAHPTVMMRREMVSMAGGYNEQLSTSQDFDLWRRLSELTCLSNLPEVFLYLRKHKGNVSSTRFQQQQENSFRISQQLISQIMQEGIPQKRIRDVWNSVWNPEKVKCRQICSSAELIYRLFLANWADPSLSEVEKDLIRKDAISRFDSLLKGRKYLYFWRAFLYLRMLKRAIRQNKGAKIL